jgi:transcription termination factor Rho
LQITELQGMTVVQLRKIAREHGVKLSAGIDKEGIVERLAESLKDAPVPAKPVTELPPSPPQELHEAPLSADVTSVAPGASGSSAWQARREENAAGHQPVYRQAWQARSQAPQSHHQPTQRPAWGQPQRPASAPTRFGPAANYTQSTGVTHEPRQGEEQKPYADAPRLDGYRLGYRAAPPRTPYQQRDDYRAPYRQEQSYPRQNNYQQPGGYGSTGFRGQDPHFNDSVYKPVRDFSFGEPYERGKPLPDLLTAAEGEEVSGVLEILPDGYGFLRAESLLPGKSDIYVSIAQIRRYGLRTGDFVEGRSRPQRDTDKFAALLYVEKLNGHEPTVEMDRLSFDGMTPVYPNRRIVLESDENQGNMPIRLVDLIAPIGFGQRAMIIAPPDSGRIFMLREIGKAIKQNDADAHVMMLMVDAAPEEVTEIRESLDIEVFASTFAESPDSQTRVSETMLESAQRLVEDGRNVVILLDSITKLTRAYQSALTQSGRAMTNTVTPAALVRPKRFFGMARNTREGGSLTIIATIAIETGSRVDDIIFEEFKGTANMELRLSTPASDDPMFPMLDLKLSGTKKDDMLLSDEEKDSLRSIRAMLGSTTNREAVVQLMAMMDKTKCNADLFSRLKNWVEMWEKSGLMPKK